MVIFQEAAVFLRSFGWTNVLIWEDGLPFQTTYSLSTRSTGNVQQQASVRWRRVAGGGVGEHQQSCLQPYAELSLFYIIHTISLLFFTGCSPSAPQEWICMQKVYFMGWDLLWYRHCVLAEMATNPAVHFSSVRSCERKTSAAWKHDKKSLRRVLLHWNKA